MRVPRSLERDRGHPQLDKILYETRATRPTLDTANAGFIELSSKSTGAAADFDISVSVNDTMGLLYSYLQANPSFWFDVEDMTGGASADADYGTIIYSYTVPQGGYAPNGNILTHSDSVMGTWNFTYDSQDRLATAVAGPSAPSAFRNQSAAWSYDANGNTTLAANGNSYTYDSENHMITANGNGKSITMVYDAFGNRVSKTVNGVTTKYLIEDDVNPTSLPQVLEEVQNGVAVRTYTYGLQRISESQFIDNVWTTSFYGYDGGGNVRQLTNSSGVVTDEYEYDAYGNSFTKQGITPNNYLYRGEQFDTDLGLYYLRARYYNPSTGRFLSRDPEDGDPTDPKTLHKYLYAGGDPVNAKDPTGRLSFEDGIVIGYIIFSVVKDVVWLSCAINTAYVLATETLEMTLGEKVKKALPVPPLKPDVICGWITLLGLI